MIISRPALFVVSTTVLLIGIGLRAAVLQVTWNALSSYQLPFWQGVLLVLTVKFSDYIVTYYHNTAIGLFLHAAAVRTAIATMDEEGENQP